MKKVIDGKAYNTKTATELFTNRTCYASNFSDWYKTYYMTKKGNFFKAYWGGATSRYGVSFNSGRSHVAATGIIPVTKEEVIRNLNNDSYDLNEEAIDKYLEIEEAQGA